MWAAPDCMAGYSGRRHKVRKGLIEGIDSIVTWRFEVVCTIMHVGIREATQSTWMSSFYPLIDQPHLDGLDAMCIDQELSLIWSTHDTACCQM